MVHTSSISYEGTYLQANASELLENLEEIFLQYYMHSNTRVIWREGVKAYEIFDYKILKWVNNYKFFPLFSNSLH